MEEKAAEDNGTYFYLSFVQRINTIRRLHILKFSAADMKIQWHMQRNAKTGLPVYDANLDDRPTFMVFDTNIRRELYLFGRMNFEISAGTFDHASIGIRINKLDGKFLHYLKFNDQKDVTAYVHPTNTNLFLGCGTTSLVTPSDGITYFKITNDGQTIFHRKIKMASSECKGLTYDY